MNTNFQLEQGQKAFACGFRSNQIAFKQNPVGHNFKKPVIPSTTISCPEFQSFPKMFLLSRTTLTHLGVVITWCYRKPFH